MFQNISKESEQEFNEEIKVNKKEEVKEIFKKLFTKQNIILYIIMLTVVNICCKLSKIPKLFTWQHNAEKGERYE